VLPAGLCGEDYCFEQVHVAFGEVPNGHMHWTRRSSSWESDIAEMDTPGYDCDARFSFGSAYGRGVSYGGSVSPDEPVIATYLNLFCRDNYGEPGYHAPESSINMESR